MYGYPQQLGIEHMLSNRMAHNLLYATLLASGINRKLASSVSVFFLSSSLFFFYFPSPPPRQYNGRRFKQDSRKLQRLLHWKQLMMMENGIFLTLSIYDKLPHSLLEVTADYEVSEEAYLALPNRKQVIYNEKNIITNLTKLTSCITMHNYNQPLSLYFHNQHAKDFTHFTTSPKHRVHHPATPRW